jgi:KDO2-lipid IV(A) lauroyltransferase
MTYIIFRFFAFLLQKLPFFVLYKLADALTFILYRIVGYRKQVVRDNLQQCFPQLNSAEIDNLVYESYRNIADILLEAFKSFGMTADELRARYQISNSDLPNSYAARGQSIIITAAHYANWEWGVKCLPLSLQHYCIATYRPLQNEAIEKYLYGSRTALGMHIYPTRETSLTFERHADQCFAMFMMPDGSPSKIELAHWINFLGRETACIHGPAKHSQTRNLPILFLHLQREKRGYYSGHYQLITDNPQSLEAAEITQKIMDAVADEIKLQPANWLWTHRRWKYKK